MHPVPPPPGHDDPATAPIPVVHPPAGGAPRARAWSPVLIAFLGVVTIQIGTFLPWVNSGRVGKNSHTVLGAVDRYLPDLPAWLGAIREAWLWQGPFWALLVVVGVLGLRRIAGLLSALAGAAVAAVAGAVTLYGSRWMEPVDSLFSLNHLGPAVCLIGAVLTVIGSAWITFLRHFPRIRAN